jgi:hypothetical protein
MVHLNWSICLGHVHKAPHILRIDDTCDSLGIRDDIPINSAPHSRARYLTNIPPTLARHRNTTSKKPATHAEIHAAERLRPRSCKLDAYSIVVEMLKQCLDYTELAKYIRLCREIRGRKADNKAEKQLVLWPVAPRDV